MDVERDLTVDEVEKFKKIDISVSLPRFCSSPTPLSVKNRSTKKKSSGVLDVKFSI